jgi:hypothetical protein
VKLLGSREEDEVGMRSIDIFLRVLTIAAFVILLVHPSSRLADILPCICFFAVGLWSVMFPAGPLGWARTAHKELDPSDESLWWVSKLVGIGLIAFSLVWAATMIFQSSN